MTTAAEATLAATADATSRPVCPTRTSVKKKFEK
jgi:hypothetical protein